MTGFEKHYTKYTCSYYRIYLLFYTGVCYANLLVLWNSLWNVASMYDVMFVARLTKDKNLLATYSLKVSSLGQILCAYKTGFLRTDHINNHIIHIAKFK